MKCEEESQRAIQGVREGVESASDKMCAAPELNPGDWKWIECIWPYIDSLWHCGDSDRETIREKGHGASQRVGRVEKMSSGVLLADQ